MKAKQPLDELRMDAGEFDAMMRRALQAAPSAEALKAKPKARRKAPAKKRAAMR